MLGNITDSITIINCC